MNLTKAVFEDANIELLRILDKYMNSNLNQSAANYRNSYLKIVHVVIITVKPKMYQRINSVKCKPN